VWRGGDGVPPPSFLEKNGADHAFSDPLAFVASLGPDAAVDIEPGMSPGEKALCPFGAQELLVDVKPKNLAGEDLR
jgi:hypothetical protein